MRIGIDIDGVLTNIEEYTVDYLSKYCIENNIEFNINAANYNIAKAFNITEEQVNNFWKEYLFDYAKNEKARPFAAEIITKLKKDGHEIYIITSRSFTNKDDNIGNIMRKSVKKWLRENNIPYDKLVFSKAAKEQKQQEILEYKIDLMVEDNPNNIKTPSCDGEKSQAFLLGLFSRQIVGKNCGLSLTRTVEFSPGITQKSLNGCCSATDTTGEFPLHIFISSSSCRFYLLKDGNSFIVVLDMSNEYTDIPGYAGFLGKPSYSSSKSLLLGYDFGVILNLIAVVEVSIRIIVSTNSYLPFAVNYIQVVFVSCTNPTGYRTKEFDFLEMSQFFCKTKGNLSAVHSMGFSPFVFSINFCTFYLSVNEKVHLAFCSIRVDGVEMSLSNINIKLIPCYLTRIFHLNRANRGYTIAIIVPKLIEVLIVFVFDTYIVTSSPHAVGVIADSAVVMVSSCNSHNRPLFLPLSGG